MQDHALASVPGSDPDVVQLRTVSKRHALVLVDSVPPLAVTFGSLDAEASWIVDKILGMRGLPYDDERGERGLAWSDVAILLRSIENTAQPSSARGSRKGIPYVVGGMSCLFDTPEAAAGPFYRLTGSIAPPLGEVPPALGGERRPWNTS